MTIEEKINSIQKKIDNLTKKQHKLLGKTMNCGNFLIETKKPQQPKPTIGYGFVLPIEKIQKQIKNIIKKNPQIKKAYITRLEKMNEMCGILIHNYVLEMVKQRWTEQ